MMVWPHIRILLLAVLGFALGAPQGSACAQKGFCDLTTETWEHRDSLKLGGEWEFYWQQYLTPDDLRAAKGRVSAYVAPDTSWSKLGIPGVVEGSEGFATYHLRFTAHPEQIYTLRFPELRSAIRVWVNDEEIARIGELSRDGKETKARQRLIFHTFLPKPGVNTITIQQSNFSTIDHGGNGGVIIGPKVSILKDYILDVVLDSITFGAMLIMAFYHFYLWWLRPSSMSTFYFGLFAFSLGFRSLSAGNAELLTFSFPETPLELQIKIEYSGIALGFVSLIYLIRELFPQEFLRKLNIPSAILTLIWLGLIVITPAKVYPHFLLFYQVLILIAGLSQIVAIGFAIKRKREGARVFLAGFGAFFLTATNDILKTQQLIDTVPLSHVGSFLLTFSQAVLLSRRFNRAFDQAEEAERKERALNEALEQKVEERTEQINTILANVSSGFLLIDRSGRLLPGFTVSCHHLLGVKLHAGQLLSEVLVTDDQTRVCFKQAVAQVFEDQLPAAVSLSQIPPRVRINGLTLGVSGAELRHKDNGRIKAILFTIHDVSSLQEAEKRVQYNETLLSIIQEREAFKVFLKDFRESLAVAVAVAAIESGEQGPVRIFLHTLKGNLGTFGITALADRIHELESKSKVEADELQGLSEMMDEFLSENDKILRVDSLETDVLEMHPDDYREIIQYINRNVPDPQHSDLIKLYQRSHQKPIRSYTGPLPMTASYIARKLGKELQCTIEGQHIRIDESYAPVLRNLIHLVRNAVDHGIELPEDRGDKDKVGHLQIIFTLDKEQFRIVCEDDGRGLDYDRIRDKALKNDLLTSADAAKANESELSQLIFMPGFSTADEITTISGRGVGMSALADAVKAMKGSIHITSRSGQGLRIEIVLPNPDALQSIQTRIEKIA
ncbi:MAG TPA: 7TM diverse intracellular signaling domain-containing protein [Oligoflexus sp.]|uniref:7TM diverse intracellular signaling domain-containing protein n=1 Tax=Oligoflexus sp. TaxID=1971216 RepID=UPI002D7FEFA0|nr:7TM diverse intracellular signaling domain-containing protein [Oligoflexus sp.]HET9236586.1 7TM diverse intracellular signaling domain-containing protein [Oligoflexus sp.]